VTGVQTCALPIYHNPPAAPLYTEYIPKKKEFRVHVWNNEVIDVVEKRKKKSFENERDTQVRNTANGYVFCRDNVVEPDDLRNLAVRAVQSLERTYGAVDIIWNERQNKSFVLEVNSRPGMQGTTVKKYADAILKEKGLL
jgi:D-alanine-D-alanine ligase-like ATP-grasp enzyme